MRVQLWRNAMVFAFGVGVISCTDPTGPTATESDLAVRTDNSAPSPRPALVISQVYGGGGNAGATLKNDFIEIFNPGNAAVSVAGWSVQYVSAAGAGTWAVTALTGSIPAGGYYLVQEAVGAGGTTNLPTPDATGTIAMGATAGKVALSSSTAALSGACPAGTVDEVSFGNGTNCGSTTAATANTTGASRNGAGCSITGSTSADFTVGAPAPRNSATAANICPAIPNPATTVSVAPNPATAILGTNQAFTATARDASNNVTSTTFTWLSRNTSVATVNASGVATAVGVGTTFIKVTTANGVADSASLTVSAAPAGDVVISQVYGGGGNGGATYTNDYVELFNRGTETATVTGWTVQYASASASSWSSTILPAATIAPGKYFLVQLSSNAAVGAPMPAPDATGTLALSATSGKIILTLPGVAPSTACPTGATIIDRVGYGTSTNCTAPADWNGNTGTLSATQAAFRKIDGCTKTGNITNDFIVLTPVPHNSASPTKNCNGVARVQSTATIVINEIMADPANAAGGQGWGEWFEVRNTGASPINLNGWKIITGGTSQPDHTIAHDVIVAPGGYAVLGNGNDASQNGGITLDYGYFVGSATTIRLDDADFLELVDGADARVDSVVWTSMPHGVTRGVRDASQPHVDVNSTINWGYSSTVFGDGDYGTPDADNAPLVDVAPIVSANKIVVSGRVATDAPLPVGFEAQLFATEMTDANVVVTGVTFTWSAQTPSIATINSQGVIHAVSAGTARFLITSSDGTAKVHTLEMVTPVASATAQYLDNAAFGEPVDADASNDFIIHRPQYTTSFNHLLGTPNWVAYDLNGTQITPGQDRCNCFTFDPELEAAGFTKYTTADYTGAGAFAGAGVDRGHMTRSFDRTSGSLDNARTFYFSNVVPQFADLNQGPWAQFENYLGDLAQNQNKEVYIYVGPAGSTGSVKGEGKINFPAWTWKIALVLPRGKGLADVHDYRDVENVIAVVMPNTPGVRNVDWATNYVVKADSVERLTGYHFMSLLDARTQRALKSGTKPPLGAVDGPYSGAAGTPVNMSAAGSVDPNGTIVSYAWSFGDGGIGSGVTTAHTYTHSGSFAVKMIVTDNDGLVDTVATTTTVAGLPPHAATDGPYNSPEGSSVSMSGASSSDAYASIVSYAWNFGDGSTGSGATTSHTYALAGSYTVKLRVTNDDGLADSTTTTANVTAVPPHAVLDGPYSANEGTSISMSASASNDPNGSIVSYAWDFGDGTTGSGATVSHTYAHSGSYTVGLTVTDNDGRTDATSTSATIAPEPPHAAVDGPYNAPEGTSISMSGAASSDANGSIVSYAWSFGDGATGSGVSTSHAYALAGSYTVKLKVTDNDGLVDSTTTTATITAVPPHAALDGPYNAPEGTSISMSGASSNDPNGSIVSYAWSFGDGTTGSGVTVSHTYAHSGSYTVGLTVTDNDGRTDAATTTATITAVPPHAVTNGPFTGSEGSSVSMSGAGSSDANGTITSYAWDFGDGSSGSGASVSHTYANNGSYTVSLTVTDNDGRTDVTSTSATISNVAPNVASITGATLLPRETYSTTGSFTDPGADTWTATVNYGDGSGTQALTLTGKTFSLSHKYSSAGVFTVTVTVSDGEVTGSTTATVTVLTGVQGVSSLTALVNQLISSGALSSGNGNSLIASLDAASNQLANGNPAAAVNQLQAFLSKVDSMVKTGKLTAAQAAPLTELAKRIIASI